MDHNRVEVVGLCLVRVLDLDMDHFLKSDLHTTWRASPVKLSLLALVEQSKVRKKRENDAYAYRGADFYPLRSLDVEFEAIQR